MAEWSLLSRTAFFTSLQMSSTLRSDTLLSSPAMSALIRAGRHRLAEGLSSLAGVDATSAGV
jgi:hypothetical protein